MSADALKRKTFRLTFAEEQNCEGHVAWSAYVVYSDVMEGELLELSSAQPDHIADIDKKADGDCIRRQAVISLAKDIFVPMGEDKVYRTKSIDPQGVMELPCSERQPEPKKYVIEKEGYSSIIVNLTEREARAIEKFLDWACLDDNFCIESVEEYDADEWGKE